MQLKRASNGTPVTLADELGSGGEGVVYLVADVPDLVAKIYYEPPEAGKAAKLSAMARFAPPELLRIAAWPTDLLLDESGGVRGFLMQRVSSREDAHELYSPKSRRSAFPDADFRFVVHAAANVSRAFAQLHALGHVIGDVNHGNALIGCDATVVLIDCDSFQVKDGDASFTCDVGVPLFTPPELQGQNFRGLVRSVEHDAFGLAVLLFHLLYAGRHPFAGMFADGEMSIERAIAESRFAYGANAGALGMSAPPGTLPLPTFGAPIAALFERAFAAPGALARPTAVEWVDAMDALEGDLTTCTVSPDHDHPKAAACCWCELESRAYIVLFGRAAHRGAPLYDRTEFDQLWSDIAAVTPPPAFTGEHARHAAAAATKAMAGSGWRWLWWLGCLWLAAHCVDLVDRDQLLAWLFIPGLAGAIIFGATHLKGRPNRQTRAAIVRDAEARVSNHKFDYALSQLQSVRQRLLAMHENLRLAISEAAVARQARQREQLLQSIMLSDAHSPALSAGEREALLSMGIASAADVLRERKQLHHALSYAKVRELIQWAENCGVGAGVTAAPLQAQDIRAVEEGLRSEASRLMTQLRVGAASLQGVRDAIVAARQDAREVVKSWLP